VAGQAGAGAGSGRVGPVFPLETLTIAGLLRCGVQHLPASISRREVLTSHPALIPNMVIPEGENRGVGVKHS
jgi:hypothetical protein